MDATSADPPTNPGTVAVYAEGFLKCSGTLIRRQWVLTAKQCVMNGMGQLFGPGALHVIRSLNPGVPEPLGVTNIDTVVVQPGTGQLALLRVELPEWDQSPMVNPAAISDWAIPESGRILRNMGYGCQTGGNGAGACVNSGRLRWQDLSVFGSDPSAGTVTQNNTNAALTDRDWGGPAYTMSDLTNRGIPGVAAVNLSRTGTFSTSVAVDKNRRWIMQSAFTAGNMHGGDRRQAGIALVGGTNWTKIRSVHVDTDDEAPAFFFTMEASATGFTEFAKTPEARALSGDFNGDRQADIVLLGGTGWDSTPTSWSPTFGDAVTNRTNADVASMTQQIDAKVATGDFDGDGWTDVVVMRGASTLVNLFMAIPDGFPGNEFFPLAWDLGASFGSNLLGSRLLTGDFNGDGLDDLAVVGNATPFSTALSNGTFTPTFFNRQFTFPGGVSLSAWANEQNASTVVGDWDGDGRDDIAVVGGTSNDIRVAQSFGNGVFNAQTFSSLSIATFAGQARASGVRVVSGDYNGDGRDDIALVGGAGWTTVPIAFSQPAQPGSWFITDNQTTFASWAQEAGTIKVVSAHPGSRLPPVNMVVEPMELNSVVYLPLAPQQNGGTSKGQVNLDILFQNTGTVNVVVDKVVVSFSGGPAVAPASFTVNQTALAGGNTRFLMSQGQPILIPQQPAPTSVTIHARIRGYDTPLTMTAALAAHVPPVSGGTWSWPGKDTDLKPGHFWSGVSSHNPGLGQGFGLDMDVRRFDSTTGWTNLWGSGTTATQNSDFIIYGMPVYAMADGTVANTRDGVPENPVPPAANLSCSSTAPPTPCFHIDGNAVYLQSGTETTTYAHLKAGSLLVSNGATVTRGQQLGVVGNSGNVNGNVHLHIHNVRNTGVGLNTLRPMPFRDVWMLKQNGFSQTSSTSPWGFVEAKGVPEVATFIFPSLSRPPWLATGVGASQSTTAFSGWPSRASDGNTDGNFWNNSVTHTDIQAGPWWKGDLGQVRNVAVVELYNRTDCCGERLSNFAIDVSQNNTSWTTAATFPGQAGPQVALAINQNARYVRVRLLGTNYLSLAEVRIWLR